MYQRADPAGLIGTNWGAMPSGMRSTGMGWPIDPGGLTQVLLDLRDSYGNPRVYITENGAYFKETPGPAGRVDDGERIRYLHDHIAACHTAIAQGVNLAGYFVWTIMDNFEWAYGYAATFGLARVDRATLTRSPKASYDWFARMVRSNAVQALLPWRDRPQVDRAQGVCECYGEGELRVKHPITLFRSIIRRFIISCLFSTVGGTR
jgi:beta-glucosidase